MKNSFLWVAFLMCVVVLSGCGESAGNENVVVPDGGETIPEYENNILSSGSGWYGDLPNGLRPMLMVNGKLFRWTGMSKEYHFIDSGEVYTVGDTSTILPDGYEPMGEINAITEEVPTQELQLRAAFEATGTVYTNMETPEAIYVLMTTDWFEDSYIRFVSDDLKDHECIAYQGRQYRINGGTDICERVKELPEGCLLIGTLKYIGRDKIPSNDLETNRISDSYSRYIDGREVYADPNDSSVIYVYEHYYWAKGDYPAWRACHLWEE